MNDPILSPRHWQIIKLVGKGKTSSQEIAKILEISPRTVKVYLGIIYSRLGIHGEGSIVRLALWARDKGLI